MNSEALASFTQSIKSDYRQIDISAYNMSGENAADSRIVKVVRNSKPNLVLTMGSNATITAKQYIDDIPIVFCMVLNPVSSGIVNNMSIPGGKITGASLDIPLETQFRYIKSVIIESRSIGVMYNPKETGKLVQEAANVAKGMGLSFITKPVNSERDVPKALNELLKKIDVLWSVADGTIFGSQSTKHILLSSLKSGVPLVGLSSAFVKAGALMALSCNYSENGKQAAEITKRILNGEDPASIPVSVPRKVYLSLNLRAADQMGIRVPDHIIKTADEVIK